jgi:hypothetical protein
MTLPELVVDCENCVQPGQLGVAVGRAVSVEGLKVVNFKKNTYAESILHTLSYLPQHQVVLVEHNSHNQLQVLVVSFLEIYVWLYHSKLLRETGLSLQ